MGNGWIKFLGTAGARFAVAKQMRSSGGIWLSLSDTNIYIDPGPGALVKAVSSRPRLNMERLDAVVLSHRHLDHSADVNVIIEAMTDGGRRKKGVVLCPEDCLVDDPVIFRYIRSYPEKIEVLREGARYKIKGVDLVPVKHIHGTVETYGIRFATESFAISYITDTRFFPELGEQYETEVIVICLLFDRPRDGVDHLSIEDAKELISAISPKLAIITHFGMTLLKRRPHLVAEELTSATGVKVVAAYDGMRMEL
jgi:phosphoribosyl 1,2-cyclic phosphodiesterase